MVGQALLVGVGSPFLNQKGFGDKKKEKAVFPVLGNIDYEKYCFLTDNVSRANRLRNELGVLN